jgi:hypothetical protein
VVVLAALLTACGSGAPGAETRKDAVELFSLDTNEQGVRRWWSDDAHMGFVYEKQPVVFRLELGNTTSARQDKAHVEFKTEYPDGQGDIVIQGEGWTCQGDALVNTCDSTVQVEPGKAWPTLSFTTHHTKKGQNQLTITWGNVKKYVAFRYA